MALSVTCYAAAAVLLLLNLSLVSAQRKKPNVVIFIVDDMPFLEQWSESAPAGNNLEGLTVRLDPYPTPRIGEFQVCSITNLCVNGTTAGFVRVCKRSYVEDEGNEHRDLRDDGVGTNRENAGLRRHQ